MCIGTSGRGEWLTYYPQNKASGFAVRGRVTKRPETAGASGCAAQPGNR